MKLAYVDLSGFRGFEKRLRVDFSPSFTIIDGRNGAGKSTVFDAVEFALTGTISKYLDAKADGETVSDYLWWSGATTPESRFVEVGFWHEGKIHQVRRTPREDGASGLITIIGLLLDNRLAPQGAIEQLCSATIIRDEHIARLSLDLKEADRFLLLRNAIGATDAEKWITRSQQLVTGTSNRLKNAQGQSEDAHLSVLRASRRLEQARSLLAPPPAVRQATTRLQAKLNTSATEDDLINLAHVEIARLAPQIEILNGLRLNQPRVSRDKADLPSLESQLESLTRAAAEADKQFRQASLAAESNPLSASSLTVQAQQLEQLVSLGKEIGEQDGKCPLCASEIDHKHFEAGLARAIELATSIDQRAVKQAELERALAAARVVKSNADERRQTAQSRIDQLKQAIQSQEIALKAAGVSDSGHPSLSQIIADLETRREEMAADLRLLETVNVNPVIAAASEELTKAQERFAKAEANLGRVRLTDESAKALHDAVRRAAAESLEERLDRALPLMAELYKRLRPHPIWENIEYSIRGDVRRFLKLQVGDEINPQFVFSSGQRRATGLAFLLSVNLSMAWSRWQSVLLDDPVQHVDDFRTVHLAEVLSRLCAGGRQVVCAVEDSALADLMCRRLSSHIEDLGKRITFGADRDGALGVRSQEIVPKLATRILSADSGALSA
ncbi:AAA family ATPase [Bradyrhizobium sp. CAR08]